jgi:hypothetical protein
MLKTPQTAGLARSQRARWKHGLYSAEPLAEQRRARELLTQSRELLRYTTSYGWQGRLPEAGAANDLSRSELQP